MRGPRSFHLSSEQLIDKLKQLKHDTTTASPQQMQAPVPIRALKVLKSNRFVIGQTVLSKQYIEVGAPLWYLCVVQVYADRVRWWLLMHLFFK